MIPGLPNPISRPSSKASTTGPEAASSLLKSAGITRRRLKKLDAIAQARDYSNTHRSPKAYSACPFVLDGIPVRRLGRGTNKASPMMTLVFRAPNQASFGGLEAPTSFSRLTNDGAGIRPCQN